jgi:hypothetical protein
MYYQAEVAYRERKEDLSTMSLHGFILTTTEKKKELWDICAIMLQLLSCARLE